MASKLLDPKSDDTNPIFLRTIYDHVTKLPELDRRKHRVLKIRLYKEKGHVGHEFLILDVFDSTAVVHLLVERRPSRRKAGESHHKWWNLRRLDFLVTDGDDIIKRVPKFIATPYYPITTLSADTDEAPTFAFVCQIMWEVQRDAPNYMLLRRQCYWFTGTVIERIKHEFTNIERDGGRFRMQVKDGPEAMRRGKPGGLLGLLKVYAEPKATQYVASQIKKEQDVQRASREAARQQMRATMNNVATVTKEERRRSREDMGRIVQPLLTTPEAYQRKHWADTMAHIEEEFQRSKEGLQRAVQPLIAIPTTQHAD